MKLLNLNDLITVPIDIATCPYCHMAIYIEIIEWTNDPEGGYKATEFHPLYACEPDYETQPRKWRKWRRQHIHPECRDQGDWFKWQLVHFNIETWLDEQIRFVDPDEDQRKLAAWYKSVLGTLPNKTKQDMTPV